MAMSRRSTKGMPSQAWLSFKIGTGYAGALAEGVGGPCGARTHDQPIKSRPLYH
jgi:hypothetical protein